VDEAHHAAGRNTWAKVLIHFPNARVLGVTATPERLDGKGLGVKFGGLFDDMVIGPTTSQLIEMGYLCKPVYYAPPEQIELRRTSKEWTSSEMESAIDKPVITGHAVKHYQRLCNGAPAIAFCVSVKHAEHITESFIAAGYRWASLHGGLTAKEQRRIISDLQIGRLHGISSCDLVSEGFDLPNLGAAILLRPTQSLSLHLQQIGRVLRTSDGKTIAYVLDHVGNTIRHGIAEDERSWSLEGKADRERRSAEEKPIANRVCPECFCVHAPAPICPQCDYEYNGGRIPEIIDGELVEFKLERPELINCGSCLGVHPVGLAACPHCGVTPRRAQGQAQSIDDLERVGRAKGYKNPRGWAAHILAARQKKKDNK